MNYLLTNRYTTVVRGIVCLTLIFCVPAMALANFQAVYKPSMTLKETVGSSIKIDGRLQDDEWKNAGTARNFVERYPGENTEPGVETEVFITYDASNLYVAFKCHDDPDHIRATMCQRDQFSGDDAVALYIDTYGDASWAYEFFVNPYGVQKDYLWTSVAGEDIGIDLIWESAARITKAGYEVEIAIPFASIRFPSTQVQDWKIDFRRYHPRENANQYAWAAHDRNEPCVSCQWGTVDGITGVKPAKGIEILPSVVANQSGALAPDAAENLVFDNSDLDGDLSLGGKYSISSDVTLEGSYNPDFSQIEADAAQIDVNSTISLFFPERRPFFQEGADLFRTLFNSFYTRTINDPQFAAKLTGRIDRYSIGFLSALDENTPYTIPLEERTYIINTGKSYVNVLRGSKTIGDGSQVGLLFTDRRLDGGGSGTVAAFDGDIRLTRNIAIDGQFIYTHTAEPEDSLMTAGAEGMTFDSGNRTVAFDGESYGGHAFITRLKRFTRSLSFMLNYNEVSPTYRTETGYDPVVDYRDASVGTWYNIYFTSGLLRRLTPQIYAQKRWDFDGIKRFDNLDLSLRGNLSVAQTYFGVSYHRNSAYFGGVDFDDLWSVGLDMGSNLSSFIGYDLNINHGKDFHRHELVKGDFTDVTFSLDLKPLDRLVIEPYIEYSRFTHEQTGAELYDGYIARTRIRLQANKSLSLRVVVQYDDFYKTWDVDPLITYRVSPFSMFYIGSTYDYADFRSVSDPSNWKLYSRQFFLKFQYLFRV